MGRRPNYDSRGFHQNTNRNSNQGVFGRLQQQPTNNQQGGWGGGQGRGNAGYQRSGQQRDNNRFGAFNQVEDREPQNNRGGQRNPRQQQQQQQQQQQGDWRAVVRDDLKNERPKWPFSCYSHQRSGKNDLVGDYSYEEVRWAEMQAVRAGRPAASLVANFNVAAKALDQQWQAVSRASRPPSLGGPPIDPPPNALSAPQPLQPGTPFGQMVGAFGSHPAAAPVTPSPSFGAAFQRSPAEAMPSAGPFPGTTAGTPSPFSTFGGFGTPAQANPSQPQQQPQHSSAPAAFGQQPQGAFNAGQIPAATFAPPISGPAEANIPDDSPLKPWLTAAFERGHIPEMPPPREVC